MRILVLSDLHLEFCRDLCDHAGQPVRCDAEVVVLAGDIHSGSDGVNWARETFAKQEIVYVPGNHEHYGWVLQDSEDAMRSTAKEHGVHLLSEGRVEVSGVTFLGTTLWTDFGLFGPDAIDRSLVASHAINDFRRIDFNEGGVIRALRPFDTLELHTKAVRWLNSQLDQCDPARTVVVTHHGPSRRSVHERWLDDELSPAFVSDLPLLLGRSALWIHGHTHDSFDYEAQDTRVICNPRGYPKLWGGWENEAFDPCLVIDM